MVGAMAARAAKPKSRHARDEIVAQLRLAAEQMRAAADVEQDAVGRIDGDERRVALAPVGDGLEQARVGGLILRHGDERGMHGARLRQREAGAQAEPLRRRVDRDQQVEVAALAVDDEGESLRFQGSVPARALIEWPRWPLASLASATGEPNSGLPEFGHYQWPKSDISDFGWPHAIAARCGRSGAGRATGSGCVARTKRCSTLFHSTIQVPR